MTSFLPALVGQDQAVFVAGRVLVNQAGGVGETGEVFKVDLACFHQAMDEGQNEQPVGAGGDADPFVGDRVVTGADRVDADDLRPAFLQFAEAHLDRVGIVVFGDAEQHEEFWCDPSRAGRTPRRHRPWCRCQPPPC